MKTSYFYHLGQRSKKYRTSSSSFRRGCQNCILRVHKNVLTKAAFFWERCKLLSLSDLQRNFFWILSKIIGEVLKTAVYVSIWILWSKRVSWRLFNCFCLFRTLSKWFLTICREIFGGVVKTAFWESMPSISWKTFCLWKKYTCFGSFRYWANKFRPLVENFLAGLRQLISMCPEEHIYEKYSFFKKSIFLFSFWDRERRFFGISSKNFPRMWWKLHPTSS